MAADNSFTDSLWRSIEGLYAEILAHPFLAGLSEGRLAREKFQYYVLQDSLYLKDFSRCLAIASAKAPSAPIAEMFLDHSRTALVVEQALHASFFAEWELSPAEIEAAEPAPTCLAYTSYLFRVSATGSFAELVAALLPCYWIYWEVGKHLEALGSPEPLFARWIETYAADEFAAVVRQVLHVMNECAAGLPPQALAQLRQHFVTTSRYEWMFWDAAWRREGWPAG
jgi:thiaminase/transcriptional activator TenA